MNVLCLGSEIIGAVGCPRARRRSSSRRASTAASATSPGSTRWRRWKGGCGMAESRLRALAARGQSIWIDLLSREFVALRRAPAQHVDEDSVTGLTSNPTIFQKALAGGHYDEQIVASLAVSDDPRAIFFELAVDRRSGGLRRARPGLRGKRRQRRLRLARGRPGPRSRHAGDARPGGRTPRAGRSAEPVRQDPGDARGAPGDRGVRSRAVSRST